MADGPIRRAGTFIQDEFSAPNRKRPPVQHADPPDRPARIREGPIPRTRTSVFFYCFLRLRM